ncbi:hypothetical protein SAMN05443377_1409 [Propionibacterium cyclohexanicum]|uniref:Uncharacterized protein n=1 Tax=Propionibacterium cyclohexanicum TaxID=64702 RepID=A0A1H9U4X8_9ACTN|nr:hypothetical protein [Propionibacterium cyclohexanicum]SES04620.1 hypothetical protein SAMN05443377_1409 [Propionibacterium cyclohexanicum]
MSVVFAAISYAGQLSVTIRLDRAAWDREELLVTALARSFSWLTGASGGP